MFYLAVRRYCEYAARKVPLFLQQPCTVFRTDRNNLLFPILIFGFLNKLSEAKYTITYYFGSRDTRR